MSSELTDLESLDQSSEYSDDDSDVYVYNWKAFVVVRANVNDRERYDCIPSSWLVFDKESGCGYQTTVTYRFPSLAKLGKGIKFRKNQKAKRSWPKYVGKMLLNTDSKNQAFQLIKHDKEKTRSYYAECGDSYSSTSELDSEEDDSRKKQNNKKQEKQGTKRTQSVPENKDIQAKSKKIENESDKKTESDKIELAKELHSHCNDFYEEFNATYQKSMSILDNTAKYLQNIISTYKAKLSSPLPTSQQQDDTILNGTKWTLRYPAPGPGIVELVPNTGVYVSENGLDECKIKYVSSTEFTRGLLGEVFTDEALRKCSYTGQPPRSVSGYPAKPGLDLNARQTLVDYCVKYSGERGWLYGDTVKEDTERIINSIRGKLYDAFQKSQ